MKTKYSVLVLVLILLSSCLRIEEEPILLINPTANISAHIKDQKIFATVLVNVNPQVLTSGNIPTIFEFLGELAIYNTTTGNEIDVKAFSGGGLSQVYSVSADTTEQVRFVVIASGTINAYADVGNDDDASNNKLVPPVIFTGSSNSLLPISCHSRLNNYSTFSMWKDAG